MSPGWHESASQIASSVEKRIARALPVLRIERLANAIPIRSASSVSVIRRSWSISSSLMAIAMSHCPFEVFAHERAFREHPGQQEREQYREPPVDRKAGIYMKWMSWTRNGFGDRADDDAENLQSKQHPGDRLQTRCVRGNERVAPSNCLNDRKQSLQDRMIEWNRDQTEHCDRTHTHNQPLSVR